MSPSASGLVHGTTVRVVEMVLVLNHPFDRIKDFPERFVVRARSRGKDGKEILREVSAPLAANANQERGIAVLYLHFELKPEESSLWLGYRESAKSIRDIPIFENLPFDFHVLAWLHGARNPGNALDADDKKCIDACTPFHAPGKWQVGHALCKKAKVPLVFLWRYEAPAFFEMHSHVQSAHCSPFPPAWVHTWDKTSEVGHAKPGYSIQNLVLPRIEGEMGEVISLTTGEIASKFRNDFSQACYESVFPFLAEKADSIACPMPMDMEYMHFDGYFGIPITQVLESRNSATKEIEKVRWYCWNRIWGFETNVEFPPPSMATPSRSERGETWCRVDGWGASEYEDWGKQYDTYAGLSQKQGLGSRLLPFYHFDPRRHRILSGLYSTVAPPNDIVPTTLDQAFSQVVQSARHNGRSKFFGYKLYTALGWAPMDPFLRDPLERFYEECERDQTPLLNHCTPAGYYTHDRRHYYDLLGAKGKVVFDTEDHLTEDGNWLEGFARYVPGPDHGFMSPGFSTENPMLNAEEECIWWFTHHYVSAQSWSKVLRRFPKLKLCLAHLGDSDHFRDDSWKIRKSREPHRGRPGKEWLTIAFDEDHIDPARTHKFLYDLIDLVKPDNHVFIDISYVILDEHNSSKFMELFRWAREHKPILLERILWGTDWPLVGDEDPVKNLKSGNMLHRYAQGFRDAVPDMPGDFFLRACFLNPLQYLDLKRIRTKLGGTAGWNWVEDMDDQHFSMDFTGDKVELLYKTNKQLHKQLA